jgi:hypothetical protein
VQRLIGQMCERLHVEYIDGWSSLNNAMRMTDRARERDRERQYRICDPITINTTSDVSVRESVRVGLAINTVQSQHG